MNVCSESQDQVQRMHFFFFLSIKCSHFEENWKEETHLGLELIQMIWWEFILFALLQSIKFSCFKQYMQIPYLVQSSLKYFPFFFLSAFYCISRYRYNWEEIAYEVIFMV